MKVADFFCGGGGFSEGFRQAGFDIVFAVDRWLPAVNTFKANKPNAKVIQDDIIRISELSDEEFDKLIPDTEVIIGSPPCVAFSNSNKSGNGDKTMGIKLLNAYLKIVARKKFKKGSILKYWVLENVPNIQKYIKKVYLPSDLGLEGSWELRAINENSKVYNAKYFGAPTKRQRFLCGEFPTLVETHNDNTAVTLSAVLDSLKDPLDLFDAEVSDCNYPELSMNVDSITDHHYEHILQDFEWETAKRLKQDRGYMGKMSFPENPAKPARTVMATMSSSSRESMILGMKNGGYRLPTVREVACMMSFPNDYRFYGTTESTKYKLVGNAVPPKLSYAVAKSILLDAGKTIPEHYIRIVHDDSIEFFDLNNLVLPVKIERRKRITSKFKYHIPYLIYSAYRVELTNGYSDFKKFDFKWSVEIHYSQGKKNAAKFVPVLTIEWLNDCEKNDVEIFIDDISKKLPDFYTFQERYCMTRVERGHLVGPHELLLLIRNFIDKLFSEEQKSVMIELRDKPYSLPAAIAVGYYILSKLLKNMEG